MPNLILSDNSTIEYRTLGLFELYDNVPFEPIGHYSYSILTITGEIIQQEIDISEIKEVPPKPDNPNPEPGMAEYWQLKEYEIYIAALAHDRKRSEATVDYLERCASYILSNCINSPIPPEDYDKLFQAVTVPQLTMEGLQAELSGFFQGNLQSIRPFRLPVRPATIEI